MTNAEALHHAQARVEEAQHALAAAREAAYALRQQAAKLERDAEGALWKSREEKDRAEALVWLDEDRERHPTSEHGYEEVWNNGHRAGRRVFRHVGWTDAGSLLLEERSSSTRDKPSTHQYAIRRVWPDFKIWCERFNITPPPKKNAPVKAPLFLDQEKI